MPRRDRRRSLSFFPRCAGTAALLRRAASLSAALVLSAPVAAQQTPSPAQSPEPTPEVAALLKAGKEAADRYRWDEALKQFRAALDRARPATDRIGEANALRAIGKIYRSIGQPQKALDALQQALSLDRQTGNKNGEATALTGIGMVYWTIGQPGKAQQFYQQAIPLYRLIGDKTGEARTLNGIGLVFQSTRQPNRALDFYQRAMPLFRQGGDRNGEATVLGNIGGIYLNIGQPDKALKFFQQALPLFQQMEDRDGEAITLNNIGIVYANTGQPSNALKYYQQVLPLYRQVENKNGEANALNNIGNIYFDIGQPSKALEFFQQALSVNKQIEDKNGEATALNNIGRTYSDIGQTSKALEFDQQAIPLYRQTGDKMGEANALHSIGVLYANISQTTKALECYRQSLSLFRQAGDKNGEARALDGIGSICRRIGQPDKALAYYRKSLSLVRQVGDKNSEGIALGSIGNAYYDIGQANQALKYYQQSLPLLRQTADRTGEANTLSDIGRVYVHRGQPLRALEFYRQSIAGIESLRAQINSDAEARSVFLQNHLAVYHRTIDLLLKQDSPSSRQEAFLLAQKVKARALLDRLGDARNDMAAQLLPAERQKEADLRAACDRLNQAMIAEGIKNEVGSKKRFEQAKINLEAAERNLSVFQDSLFARYPDLAARRVARTAALTDIVAALPPDAALIEFVRMRDDREASRPDHGEKLDRTVAFVVDRQHNRARLLVYDTGLTASSLSKLSHRLHAACSHVDTDYAVLSGQLYRPLLGKAETVLTRKRSLIVCPDADLWQIPFAALTTRSGNLLLERYNLSVAYSATGWRAAKTIRKTQRAASATMTGVALALADPAFGGVDRLAPAQRPINIPDRPITIPDRPISVPDRAANLGMIDRAEALHPLPGTRQEAIAIQRNFPDAVVLLGRDAQEAAFKKQATHFRYLHLATHGFFNDASPLLSSLVLAAPPASGEGSEEDGLLTAREILELDLSHCEMAVLSACNTGVGKQQSGEGLVGLTWCLTAAGCPSQVVSGWQVNDAATAQLMAEFYRELKAGKSKASALRSAALSLRHSPATRHPYYWAPFFLVGADE